MKNYIFFILLSYSVLSQNIKTNDDILIESNGIDKKVELPDINDIKPNQIIVYDKTYTKKIYEFEVHYVFEEEIYARWGDQGRMRVVAFLYPRVIKEFEDAKVFVVGLTGSRIDDPRPSPSLGSIVFTDNYSIIGKKQSDIRYNKNGFVKQNLTKHICLRHQSHVPYEVFWGYGLTDSTIFGNYNNNIYRIDSILIPGIISEIDLNLLGVNIKCFGHLENQNGTINFIKGVGLRDDKILSVVN